MNIGRWRRAFSARSTAPRPMIGSELAVHETTMSNSSSRAGRSASADRLAAEARAELLAALERAVGDRHARAAVRAAKCVADELDHLAGADEQHLGLAQVLEQLRGQPHRRRRHADRVRADLGRRCALPWRPRTSAGTAGAACCRACRRCSASRTASFIWPRICGSPSTIESRPLATRNACRAAARPSST